MGFVRFLYCVAMMAYGVWWIFFVWDRWNLLTAPEALIGLAVAAFMILVPVVYFFVMKLERRQRFHEQRVSELSEPALIEHREAHDHDADILSRRKQRIAIIILVSSFIILALFTIVPFLRVR